MRMPPFRRVVSWLLATCVLLLLLPDRVLAEDLAAFARRRARELGLREDSVALAIRGPGSVRALHRADVPLRPASNLKLVTAAAALELLGAEFTLTTELWATGAVQEGTLHGDLVVVGHGDPGLDRRFGDDDPLGPLRQWPALLRELGISRVSGGLRGDDTYLEGPTRLPEWPRAQLHRWYCAPSGALNLNDNCVDVVIGPVRPVPAAGHRIGVRLEPAGVDLALRGTIAATARKKEHLYRVDRAVGSVEIRVGGKFLASAGEHREPITVLDPTTALLGALAGRLQTEGVVIEGASARGRLPEEAWRVARVGHRVDELLPVLLKRSQNLYGDCLLRVVAREQGGDGSFASGGRALTRYLKALGVDVGSIVIRDGSGLSQQNRLTARTLLTLMEHAHGSSWGPVFLEALPLAGVDGTLSRRFRRSELAGRVRAKTGHVRGVTALTGVLETERGPVLFSLLYDGRPQGTAAAQRWQQSVLEEAQKRLRPPQPRKG